MAQTTGIQPSDVPCTPAPLRPSALSRVWEGFKLGVKRSIFWSYERGTWQYDVIVVAILAFIFLSPRSWFDDRPTLQLTNLRNQQGIVELRRAGREVHFLVDARLIDPRFRKPEDAIAAMLQQHLQKPFTLKTVDAVRDRHNVILGYTVVVEE